MGNETEKSVKTYDLVKVDYLRRLRNKGLSEAEIGTRVGKTDSAINKYLRLGMVSRTVELAARFIYETEYAEKGGTPPRHVTAIIQGELGQLKTIKDFVAGLGGKFAFVGDM